MGEKSKENLWMLALLPYLAKSNDIPPQDLSP